MKYFIALLKKIYSIEIFWIILSQIITSLGGLLVLKINTTYLDIQQFGHLTLGLTLCIIVDNVIIGGVSQAVARYYSIAREKNQLKKYIINSLNILVIILMVIVLVSLALSLILFYLNNFYILQIFNLSILYAVLSSINGVFNSIQNAARKRMNVAITNLILVTLKILLILTFISIFGADLLVVFMALIICTFLVVIYQIYYLSLKYKISIYNLGKIDKNWFEKIIRYALPFSIWGIFTSIHQSSDRWSLEVFGTTEMVANYSVLIQIGYTPIIMLTTLTILYIAPVIYDKAGSGTSSEQNKDVSYLIWRIGIIGMMLTILAFTVAIFSHDQIFRLIIPLKYSSISIFLPWMIISAGIFSSAQALSLNILSKLKSFLLLKVKIVTSVMGILMNIYGVISSGINGLIFSQILYSLIYLIWIIYLCKEEQT